MASKAVFRRGIKGLLGVLAVVAVAVAAGRSVRSDRQAPAPAPGDAPVAKRAAIVLPYKERGDVDGDGKPDLIGYFDDGNDGEPDREVIDIGATGRATVLAIRCDADSDGLRDDWAVVDAESEEVRAVLVDGDDDGRVDWVTYRNGETEPLPAGVPRGYGRVFSH